MLFLLQSLPRVDTQRALAQLEVRMATLNHQAGDRHGLLYSSKDLSRINSLRRATGRRPVHNQRVVRIQGTPLFVREVLGACYSICCLTKHGYAVLVVLNVPLQSKQHGTAPTSSVSPHEGDVGVHVDGVKRVRKRRKKRRRRHRGSARHRGGQSTSDMPTDGAGESVSASMSDAEGAGVVNIWEGPRLGTSRATNSADKSGSEDRAPAVDVLPMFRGLANRRGSRGGHVSSSDGAVGGNSPGGHDPSSSAPTASRATTASFKSHASRGHTPDPIATRATPSREGTMGPWSEDVPQLSMMQHGDRAASQDAQSGTAATSLPTAGAAEPATVSPLPKLSPSPPSPSVQRNSELHPGVTGSVVRGGPLMSPVVVPRLPLLRLAEERKHADASPMRVPDGYKAGKQAPHKHLRHAQHKRRQRQRRQKREPPPQQQRLQQQQHQQLQQLRSPLRQGLHMKKHNGPQRKHADASGVDPVQCDSGERGDTQLSGKRKRKKRKAKTRRKARTAKGPAESEV